MELTLNPHPQESRVRHPAKLGEEVDKETIHVLLGPVDFDDRIPDR